MVLAYQAIKKMLIFPTILTEFLNILVAKLKVKVACPHGGGLGAPHTKVKYSCDNIHIGPVRFDQAGDVSNCYSTSCTATTQN